MASELIDYTLEDRVARIGINRPDRKNALTKEMYLRLSELLRQIQDDEQVHVIFLHGAKDMFCSGNDLQEFLDFPPDSLNDAHPVLCFLRELADAEKPIVAAVAGNAIGIGTTMLLHCDLVYASEGALFQLPFIPLGLVPEASSTYLLPRLIGHQRAAELFFFGRSFSAEEARAYGIVTKTFSEYELRTAALLEARVLANQPPRAVQATKQLMKRAACADVVRARNDESTVFIEQLRSSEAQTAIRKFLAR